MATYVLSLSQALQSTQWKGTLQAGDAVRSGILRVLQLHKLPLPFMPLVLSVRESQSSKDLVPATEQWFATGGFTGFTPALVSTAQRPNPLAASVTFTFSFS